MLEVIELGQMDHAAAFEVQRQHHARVLELRDAGTPEVGRLLFVEHVPPVITVSRRPDAREHLTATPEMLARAGVEVCETDRGGDITYHGPGQLVAYPIIDLNTLGLNLHAYMRLLEDVVIATLARFGVEGKRESGATGVWVVSEASPPPASKTRPPPPLGAGEEAGRLSKICAMGVRIRRWVTMHGLALNITTNLEHFDLIVPCGLAGRGVTSLRQLLGEDCPSMDEVKRVMAGEFRRATAAPPPSLEDS
jgi:lipoyl(octanoyl) transferase